MKPYHRFFVLLNGHREPISSHHDAIVWAGECRRHGDAAEAFGEFWQAGKWHSESLESNHDQSL